VRGGRRRAKANKFPLRWLLLLRCLIGGNLVLCLELLAQWHLLPVPALPASAVVVKCCCSAQALVATRMSAAPAPARARALSARSSAALTRLGELSARLGEAEREFVALVHEAAGGPPATRLVQIKNELAQLVGALDKLQMGGIDAVATHELESGQDEARTERKELNARSARLAERLVRLHGSIAQHLDSLPPPASA
jgi:hypothetical protein